MLCPIPIGRYSHVVMAHGGGGRLMHDLIERVFLHRFGPSDMSSAHDSATLEAAGTKLAFTTDSYVVRPLFFPGGDIGSLAVNGTVNDLAMSGARPLAISAAFILEEGLPVETLDRIVASMRHAADAAGVSIVTGDTKVVDRGKADGVFISTAGVGVIEHGLTIRPSSIRAGDAVIVSGDLGRHGIAVMAVREDLAFESPIESDCAPLVRPVMDMIAAGVEVHCMRDLTRGGLASALNELASGARLGIRLKESLIEVRDEVLGACELLGFDPLYVANEGRFVAFVPERDADLAIEVLRRHEVSAASARVGLVTAEAVPPVTLATRSGSTRIMDMLTGEQLPRIC
ncbi:MAG: hydrogenase expression/formation protein HypE [Vicinamibacterales bacterium]